MRPGNSGDSGGYAFVLVFCVSGNYLCVAPFVCGVVRHLGMPLDFCLACRLSFSGWFGVTPQPTAVNMFLHHALWFSDAPPLPPDSRV